MHAENPESYGEKLKGVAYRRRPGAYAVLRNEHGEVGVIRVRDWYALPGGGIEADEQPREALVREVLEETGLIVEIGEEIGSASQFLYAREEDTYFEKVGLYFHTHIVGTAPECRIDDDHELIWLPLDQAIPRMGEEAQAAMLRRLLPDGA